MDGDEGMMVKQSIFFLLIISNGLSATVEQKGPELNDLGVPEISDHYSDIKHLRGEIKKNGLKNEVISQFVKKSTALYYLNEWQKDDKAKDKPEYNWEFFATGRKIIEIDHGKFRYIDRAGKEHPSLEDVRKPSQNDYYEFFGGIQYFLLRQEHFKNKIDNSEDYHDGEFKRELKTKKEQDLFAISEYKKTNFWRQEAFLKEYEYTIRSYCLYPIIEKMIYHIARANLTKTRNEVEKLKDEIKKEEGDLEELVDLETIKNIIMPEEDDLGIKFEDIFEGDSEMNFAFKNKVELIKPRNVPTVDENRIELNAVTCEFCNSDTYQEFADKVNEKIENEVGQIQKSLETLGIKFKDKTEEAQMKVLGQKFLEIAKLRSRYSEVYDRLKSLKSMFLKGEKGPAFDVLAVETIDRSGDALSKEIVFTAKSWKNPNLIKGSLFNPMFPKSIWQSRPHEKSVRDTPKVRAKARQVEKELTWLEKRKRDILRLGLRTAPSIIEVAPMMMTGGNPILNRRPPVKDLPMTRKMLFPEHEKIPHRVSCSLNKWSSSERINFKILGRHRDRKGNPITPYEHQFSFSL